MINSHSFLLTLTHYKDIGSNTRHFTFQADKSIEFLPGQFISLYFRDQENKVYRHYSLANQGGYNLDNPGLLEIAAAYVPNGLASEKLFSMQIGDTLEATGPFGRMTLPPMTIKRYLLIATGTGVTPYRTMLPEFAKRIEGDSNLMVLLLFGVRYRKDFLYHAEWIHFAKQYPQFSFKVYYSREAEIIENYEYQGYVQKALKEPFTVDPEKDIAYLCGNPNMVNAVHHILSEKGLGRDRIKQERYTSPKKQKLLESSTT